MWCVLFEETEEQVTQESQHTRSFHTLNVTPSLPPQMTSDVILPEQQHSQGLSAL